LQLALSLHEPYSTLRNLLFIFLFAFPAILILVVGLGYVFMKRAFSPIKRMVAVTRSITAEDLSLRLDPIDSHDEIGELADTLNAMIARLDRSFQQIRQFSGDVSHELKTPLADLTSNAEIMLRKDRSKEEYRTGILSMIDDAKTLQKIIDDLLFLASSDAHNVALAMEPLALHDIFLEMFEAIQPLAREKQLGLALTEIDLVSIQGDPGLLKRLFFNLMTNAIAYTPPGGEITFSLRNASETKQAIATIGDTGVGIPEESLPYIFDRFYRVDPSRSHRTGGSGLGLAIVKKIVDLHAGKISVQSTVGHGTTFIVYLPSLS
jgi:heavy metal sensor kinase